MKLLVILFIVCITTSAFGQNIDGKVVNQENKALEFVSVNLKKDSIIIASTITDHSGNFQFNNVIAGSTYVINFSLIGYKSADTTISYDKKATIYKRLFLEEKQLKTVSVIARKNLIERKIDRLVFNVENNINTIGSDGLDLLSKTPMVRVVNDQITLIGKEGVAIMIDNRLVHLSGPALAAFLKSMNASNISKIEVITNPPAEYDAQGNSGLINIVTKKIKVPGYSGTITSNVTQDTYTTFAEGINLNYNVNKLLLVGSFTTADGANGPSNSETRFYDLQTWQKYSKPDNKSKYYSGTIGFDYLLSKKTTIGASFNAFTSYPNAIGSSNTIIRNNQSNLIDSILKVNFLDNKTFITKSANFHLTQKLDSLGKELVFDADYYTNTFNTSNNTLNTNTYADGSPTSNPSNNVVSNNDLGSKGYTLNAVVKFPFKKISLTFGAKASFISSNSDVSIYQSLKLDSTNANRFQFNENTQAIFGSLNTQFGKWQLQAGLRGEATQTKGIAEGINQDNTNAYLGVFPTFYLTYELNKNNTLAINYGRRIGRPNFSSFNPYRVYFDQYDYYTGNPYLKPSFSNNFELSNTYKHLLTTTISYSVSNGLPISLAIIQNGSNIQEGTVGNYLSTKDFLFDNSISVQLLTWLENTDELSIYYNTAKSTSPLTQPALNGSGADFTTINSFYFNKAKTFIGGMDFTYQFPYRSGLSSYKKYYFTDLSGSYVFLNKKMQITMSIRDVFKTKTLYYSNIINGIGTLYSANNDSRRFLLNLKYSFGNSKMRKGQTHNSSSSEQNRAGH